MDYLQPGLREIGRRVARQIIRARLVGARRRRAHALTELGLLGWQAADFDAETQRQVDAIQSVEREQSRALHASATAASGIRRLVSEREAAQRVHYEARKQLEADLRKAAEAKSQLERKISEKSKIEPQFQHRLPELDRELREVNKLYSQLLVHENQTPKTKQELIRLRERIVAIPNEKNDVRTQHLRAVTEVRALEENLARQAEATTAAQQRIHYADSQWQAKEAEFLAQIKGHEKEKAVSDKQFASLENAKSNPYQRIGEVLAGSGVAPINQPQSLQRVREIELEIALLDGEIHDSMLATAKEDPAELRVSLWLWGGLGAVLLVVLAGWIL